MSMFDAFFPELTLDKNYREEIQNVTRSFLANIIRRPRLPDILYHYTNMKGLHGIVDSGMLWATHIAYMNDFSEYLHAVLVAGRTSGELKNSETQPAKAKFYTSLERLLHPNQMSMEDYPPIFVSCFSKAEDNLSQWRAYGRGEGSPIPSFTRSAPGGR